MNTYISDLFFNYEPAVSAETDAHTRQAARDFIDTIRGAFGVSIDIEELLADYERRI